MQTNAAKTFYFYLALGTNRMIHEKYRLVVTNV